MKRFNGFSLMEMMVVLLIVSVVAAASAPMINNKLLQEASEKSPWVRTRGMSIAYNLNAASNQTASIGAPEAPSIGGMNPKFYIRGISGNAPLMFLKEDLDPQKVASDNAPVITIDKATRRNNQNAFTLNVPVTFMRLGAYTNTASPAIWNLRTVFDWYGRGISLTTATKNSVGSGCVTIGDNAQTFTQSSVGIGEQTQTRGHNSVAIGSGAISQTLDIAIGARASTANGDAWGRRIAIGSFTGSEDDKTEVPCQATGDDGIAIGTSATSHGTRSIAIGFNASVAQKADSEEPNVSTNSSIAIGNQAKATKAEAIAMGTLATAEGERSVAIGDIASAIGDRSFALGYYANSARDSVAIGDGTHAKAPHSIAIGTYWSGVEDESHVESVAIGYGAKTTAANQIVLGGYHHTTYIPGNLVVDGNVCLAKGSGKKVFMRTKYHGTSDDSIGLVRRSSAGSGRDLYVDLNDELPDWTQKSDRRLKNVGKVFTGGLEEIKKLEVFNYTFKKDEEKTPRVGVIAQDLQKIFPNAVFKGDDGFLRIRMEDMFYALVNAVKELDKKIEEFKNQEFIAVKKRIDVLEKENKELKEQNKAFEKRLAELEKKLK